MGVYSVAAVAQSEVSDAAPLTAAERTWLSLHPVIKLTPDPHFPPLEYFDEQGVFRGIGADFIALLEQKLGLRFEIVQVKDWQQSVARTKARENDVWSVVAETPERSEYMLFTAPYIESPAVIIVRSDVERSLSLTNLKGLKVAVSSGYAVHEFLRNKLPGMSFDSVPDPLTGLKKVSFGMADVMVVNLALASHLIEKAGIGNLRLAGEVGYGAWVEVAVSDDGVGMAADQVENLFRLDRLQSTRGTNGEAGTGLGLLLCKDFVERHGGPIAVDSAPGQGSTFRIRLPAAGQEIAPS